jgi:uncharacterized phage protein (TIGR02220 family)
MDENKRDFKGIWITREVWLDRRLNALEKVILMEIDSLDSTERGCYASNKYIADFCQCSETKVSTAISKLVTLGYLTVKSFDGRQRELKSSLSNSERQPIKNEKAASQNLKESNIVIKTVNKTDKNNYIASIVQHLNERAGTSYRASSKATARHIEARLNEGYTLQDFFDVIDKKVAEWKGGEMEKYLRPETLFGSKFEGYLNARVTSNRRGENGVLMDDRTADELDAIF